MASISHIDTCFPCYLQDHHNRAGELLIGVPVSASTTYSELREALLDEYNAVADEAAPSSAEIEEKFDRLFDGYDSFAPFDDSLELEYEEEAPQAWFLVSWETDDE